MKISFFTFGCKVNQYETQEMTELFENAGHTIINNIHSADVCVVNSCTVTAESVRKVRQTVRKIKKTNPNCILILTGCASQAEPEIVNDLPSVDILMGNRSNTEIINALNDYLQAPQQLNRRIEHLTGDLYHGTGITRFDGHTRAFLKIQDGCDRFCSYCLIPYARGRSRSKSLEDIDKELKALNDNGYKEIVFVGINLSDYGKGTEFSLPDALKLTDKYDGIQRVRLGSLEPDHIDTEMISGLREVKKLCPQFHISVQSGCDNVLKKMNRHYTAKEYEDLCKELRETFPDATITTDILVGFPTETEEDFKETVEFVKRVKFERTHIFPYSVREGTVAAKYPQLTNAVKEERAKYLSMITKGIQNEILKSYIGKTVNVLFETNRLTHFEGYTENYTHVKVYNVTDMQGEVCKVEIIGVDEFDGSCVGEIVE